MNWSAARGRELKDENKVTKAKEDRLMEEVGKLNEEMRRVTAQHYSLMKDLAEATDLLHKLGQFPPSVKEGKYFNVTEGIISHLTKECGGNVHDRKLVATTAGSFEKTTYNKDSDRKQVADLESRPSSWSDYCNSSKDIPASQKVEDASVLFRRCHSLFRRCDLLFHRCDLPCRGWHVPEVGKPYHRFVDLGD
jgi:hypothetical protein